MQCPLNPPILWDFETILMLQIKGAIAFVSSQVQRRSLFFVKSSIFRASFLDRVLSLDTKSLHTPIHSLQNLDVYRFSLFLLFSTLKTAVSLFLDLSFHLLALSIIFNSL